MMLFDEALLMHYLIPEVLKYIEVDSIFYSSLNTNTIINSLTVLFSIGISTETKYKKLMRINTNSAENIFRYSNL